MIGRWDIKWHQVRSFLAARLPYRAVSLQDRLNFPVCCCYCCCCCCCCYLFIYLIIIVIALAVEDPGHSAKSAGGRLHLNTHTQTLDPM